MGGGWIVLACVAAAVGLIESVPRIVRALRHWQQERVRAADVEVVSDGPTPAKEPEPPLPEAVVSVADREAELLAEIERLQAEVARLQTEVARLQTEIDQRERQPVARPPAEPEPERSVEVSARQLWDEAREMPHRFIPNPETDGVYLDKVYRAAKLGHLEAMVKLGDYACRRGAIVEAYYWAALAELKGAQGLEALLRDIKTQWLSAGCPTEYENAYKGFSKRQGSFARALLCIRCAVDAPLARARMKELADAGCEEARLFLSAQ